MEKKCENCSKTRNTPYKNLCRSCYQNKWNNSLEEKKCRLCDKKFKTSGHICHSCMSNLRNEKSKSSQCSECKRTGLIIRCKKNVLCIKCHRKKKESENPELLIKRRDYLRKYSRIKRGTDLDAPIKKSSGRWLSAQGYVIIHKKNHPNSYKNGCISEHVFIMSEHLGRPLLENENVHHINGIRDDNRIENLELWHRGQCPGQRLQEKLLWCKKLLEEYGYTVVEPGD